MERERGMLGEMMQVGHAEWVKRNIHKMSDIEIERTEQEAKKVIYIVENMKKKRGDLDVSKKCGEVR